MLMGAHGSSWLAQIPLLLSHNFMAAARRTTSCSLGAETQLPGASDAPMPQHYYEEPNPDRSAVHTDVIALQPGIPFGVTRQAQLQGFAPMPCAV